ncbi:MAG: UPF0721 transmembrane protein [Rhizobiaceae bacterium MnEN-MB40S]|nr:MAG: UPF0721 transmembrane protein [Rhizobiaceae bacterium MnEN-MB40S]
MPPINEIIVFIAVLAVAGAIAGFLAGLFGIGGGAILVPVLYEAFRWFDTPDSVKTHLAIGTSLAVIVPTSLSSFRAHYKRKAPDMDLLKSWLLPVPLGVAAASVIAAGTSGEILRSIFALLAAAMGLKLIFSRDATSVGDRLPRNPAKAMVGFVIGLLSALMGVGGGILNNTFMTMFGRPVHQAIATSSGVGVLISLPGVIGFIWAGWGAEGLPAFSTGYVNWMAVALTIPMTMLAAPQGARVAHGLDRKQLSLALGIFMIVVATRFIWSLFAG